MAYTESGVSPRPLPGVKGGIHHVTGVEHNEEGKPSEAADNRNQQMDKRMRKVEHLLILINVQLCAYAYPFVDYDYPLLHLAYLLHCVQHQSHDVYHL